MATTVLIDAPKGLISTVNASTTPLTGAATFTGTAEQNFFPDVMVSCYADVAGTLYFDFSIDGTNWRTFPSAGFVVAAGIHEFHNAVKGPRYFRARFINGSSAQATFQLATYYGTFRQLNSPINSTLGADSDAIVVRSVDTTLDLALGRVGGMSENAKFGYVEAIDAADNPVDVWAMATDSFANRLDQKTWPTAAATLYMASSNNADTATVTVEYLTSTGAEATVSAALTGQTPVNLGVSGLDCNRAYLSGDTETHAGNIFISRDSNFTSGVPTTIANTLAMIPAGYGQTHQCMYRVPLAKIMRTKQIIINSSRASGAAGSIEIHIEYKSSGGSWRVIRELHMQMGTTVFPTTGMTFQAGSFVRVVLQNVSDSDTNVSAEIQFDLVDA